MNKVHQLLEKQNKVLSIYFTAEFPYKNSTQEVIIALQEAGADLIEIGIPFSDPLADGIVIQKSSEQALQNGFTLERLFKDLDALRDKITIPMLLMGYFNTVLAYGVDKFLTACQQVGIDTLILPDLPFDIYEKHYQPLFEAHQISLVYLITPQTIEERILYIDTISHAFIYAVADNSITGTKKQFSDKQIAYLQRLQQLHLKNPLLVGFGISDKPTFDIVCEYAQGAIIGSAYIRALENTADIKTTTIDFIQSIKSKTSV